MGQCLVTGGAGFIGSHLVEGLVEAGHKVRILDDLSTGKVANLSGVREKVELVQGSITDSGAVAQAVEGCEVVFHLAALASVAKSVEDPLLSHEICATGTLKILHGARTAGVRRVVYAASSSAYGNAPDTLQTEATPLQPLSPYAAAKLAGEHYCNSFTAVYGLETVRLRFFNIFGPRQDSKSPYSGVIALFASAMVQGRVPRVDGDGEQSRDFNYVGNVVQALMKAAQSPKAVGNVYNIGGGGRISILQLVKTLNDLLGTDIHPQHGPPRLGDVRHSQADISRARADLGYEPTVSFQEGLRRTLEFEKAARQ